MYGFNQILTAPLNVFSLPTKVYCNSFLFSITDVFCTHHFPVFYKRAHHWDGRYGLDCTMGREMTDGLQRAFRARSAVITDTATHTHTHTHRERERERERAVLDVAQS